MTSSIWCRLVYSVDAPMSAAPSITQIATLVRGRGMCRIGAWTSLKLSSAS